MAIQRLLDKVGVSGSMTALPEQHQDTEHQTVSQGIEAGGQSLRKTLLTDFRLSFLFSQGGTNVQQDIYYGLKYIYADQSLLDPIQLLLQSEEFETIKAAAEKLVPPKAHPKTADGLPITAVQSKYSAISEWKKFTEILEFRQGRPRTRDELERAIGRGILSRDFVFLHRDNGRKAHVDPWHSYYRQHVLLREATGSTAFDALFDRVRTVNDREQNPAKADLFGREFETDLAKIRVPWILHHPDEEFIPG